MISLVHALYVPAILFKSYSGSSMDNNEIKIECLTLIQRRAMLQSLGGTIIKKHELRVMVDLNMDVRSLVDLKAYR